MRPPIYEPKGKAKEYGDLAINIYTGCPHRCFYCVAPNVLHQDKERFHTVIEPRPGIVEAVRAQIEREGIKDKLIHLCFTCDPYPTGYDSTATREIIKIIKETCNHVQILTKGEGSRDFDLLDKDDWYGITIDGAENEKDENIFYRTMALAVAKLNGFKTWVSFEPVLDAPNVLRQIKNMADFGIDRIKIGKLNYYHSDIDWAAFGREAEAICKERGADYYIKDSLRKEMEQ